MMHSSFPGMDPYLEAPSIWLDVHTSLMSIFREQLTPLLAPKYLAELETQVVIDRLDDDPIEIDLLRRYPRMPFDDPLPPAHYLVMVCKAGERPRSSVWPISVRQPLPTIPIPVLSPDPPVPLELGQALRTAYERARYDLRVDYRQPPIPPLSPADTAWAEALTEPPGGRPPQDVG
jgi:hypothetical protein